MGRHLLAIFLVETRRAVMDSLRQFSRSRYTRALGSTPNLPSIRTRGPASSATRLSILGQLIAFSPLPSSETLCRRSTKSGLIQVKADRLTQG